MAFSLGEILEASDTVIGEILSISSDHARQRLARARQKLRWFLTGRSSWLDANGTCHCERKTEVAFPNLAEIFRSLFNRPGVVHTLQMEN
jgi:hypothetical protein